MIFGKRDEDAGDKCSDVEQDEIMVAIPTGKWVQRNFYSMGSPDEKIVEDRGEDVLGSYGSVTYSPYEKPVPIKQAVELIIKHLGVRLDYELPKDPVEEKINGLKKIKKSKKK